MAYRLVADLPAPAAPMYPAANGGAAACPDPTGVCGDFALLAHFDGTHGSTAMVDSSAEAHTLTAVGTAALTTAFSRFGGAALNLSAASGNYVHSENTGRFNLITVGDLIDIEGWVYPKATSASGTLMALVSTYKNAFGGWHCGLRSNGTNYSLFFSDGTSSDTVFTAAIPVGAWTHFAFSGSYSAMRAFADGTQVDTTKSWVGPYRAGDRLRIGGIEGASPKAANVYLDDLRITKPLPRHLTSFTPPTAAYPDP